MVAFGSLPATRRAACALLTGATTNVADEGALSGSSTLSGQHAPDGLERLGKESPREAALAAETQVSWIGTFRRGKGDEIESLPSGKAGWHRLFPWPIRAWPRRAY